MDNEQAEKLLHVMNRIANAEEQNADAARSIARLADIVSYILSGLVILVIGIIVIGFLSSI